jgi:uncharacterized protein YkwD
MREGELHGIIACMRLRTGSGSGTVLLWRYGCAVAAILAVLIAVLAGERSAASASSYDSEELKFLELINRYRADNRLGPLRLSDNLTVASERHSQDMARYRFFAHTTAASSHYPAGSWPWDRMRAEGYDYNTFMGENIATGYETAEEAFQAWRRSPSHNAAMLDSRYRVIGIARLRDAGSRWYWTTDFGTKVDPTAHAPGEPSRAEDGKPPEDGPELENGELSGDAVWGQEATDRAELILDGHARLGKYDNGKDELRQEIRVPEKDTELAYGVRITTEEREPPFDRLLVRLTNEEGGQIAVLERYGKGDAGGWRRERVDLSDYAGRTVYLSFLVETDAAGLTALYIDDVGLSEDRS